MGLIVGAVAAVLLIAAPAFAALPQPVYQHRLTNGLRVVIRPDPDAADVSVLVRYDVGARDEPDGLDGIAHLVEHLMFSGSRHAAAGEHIRLLSQAGATDINAETTMDATTYHETIPPRALDLALWLESDRMGYLLERLDDATVARHRAVITEEFRVRVTGALLGEVNAIELAELFPPWHPYAHQPTGTSESLARLTLDHARAFMSTWYGPGNATVFLDGRVAPELGMALVERYFSTLPSRPPPTRPTLPPLPPITESDLHVAAAITRSETRFAWVTPRYAAPGDLELDLVAEILAGQAGWLHRWMTVPRVATQVAARQLSMDLASVFEVTIVLTAGREPEEAVPIMDEAIGRLAHGDIAADDLFRAKSRVYNKRLFKLDTSLAWCGALASASSTGRLANPFYGGLLDYGAITPDQLRTAVVKYLGRAHRIVTLIRPNQGYPTHGVLVRKSRGS